MTDRYKHYNSCHKPVSVMANMTNAPKKFSYSWSQSLIDWVTVQKIPCLCAYGVVIQNLENKKKSQLLKVDCQAYLLYEWAKPWRSHTGTQIQIFI